VSAASVSRELLLNGIEWGGHLNPEQKVRVACLRTRRMLLYRIADPGPGFSFENLVHAAAAHAPGAIAHDRVREEKGLRPGGFGLVLIRAIADELIYNERQNEVVFIKYLRQHFYAADIGKPKAIQLVRHLRRECISATRMTGHAMRLQQAVGSDVDLRCDVVVCGVDNNPTRMLAARYFHERNIPVVFLAVSAEADHGYVFVQEANGPCLGCLFPDAVDDERYPCPGTPAMADIIQVVGGVAVYAVDSCLMARPRSWNYRSVSMVGGGQDAARQQLRRVGCLLCFRPEAEGVGFGPDID
jgi:molybdopterin/thiamine biosynthesis adenylyltransferase